MAFLFFVKLPPELRQLIWNLSLPCELGQAFFYYKANSREPTHLTENAVRTNDDADILQTYHHELMHPVHFESSLLFVNHEARYVARKWLLRKQHVAAHQSQHDQSIRFACQFDVDRDCLYIDPSHLIYMDKIVLAQLKYLAIHITTLKTVAVIILAGVLVCQECLGPAWNMCILIVFDHRKHSVPIYRNYG